MQKSLCWNLFIALLVSTQAFAEPIMTANTFFSAQPDGTVIALERWNSLAPHFAWEIYLSQSAIPGSGSALNNTTGIPADRTLNVPLNLGENTFTFSVPHLPDAQWGDLGADYCGLNVFINGDSRPTFEEAPELSGLLAVDRDGPGTEPDHTGNTAAATMGYPSANMPGAGLIWADNEYIVEMTDFFVYSKFDMGSNHNNPDFDVLSTESNLGPFMPDGNQDVVGQYTLTVSLNTNDPFFVTDTSPVHTSLDVPVNSTVDITFSGIPSIGSLDTSSFRIWGKQTGFYTSSFLFPSANSIGINSTNDFKPGENIVVMLTDDIFSTVLGVMLEPYSFEFVAAAKTSEQFIYFDSGQGFASNTSFDVSLGDIDGDGDLDAWLANLGPNSVWLNDGKGTFLDTGQSIGTNSSQDVSLGDLDQDGDLDAWVANTNGLHSVWLNDGAGIFTNRGQSILDPGYFVSLGDMDGDGNLDAWVTASSPTNFHRVWLNDGTGTGFLHNGQNLIETNLSFQTALGDLDGDGDLDAYVAMMGPNRVWFNDGNGNFSTNLNLFGNSKSSDIDLGDLDGDLDAWIANEGANNVWLNDGSGVFTANGQSLGNSFSVGVSLGDVDGDGDLDAWVAIRDGVETANRVWLNDGSGTNFTDSGQDIGSSRSFTPELGDLDGDGDLDAWVANGGQSPEPNKVWLNLNDSDEDGDMQFDYEEFIADTDSNDSNDFFKVTAMDLNLPAELSFESSTNRIYSLQYTHDLGAGIWIPVEGQTNVPGLGGTQILMDTNDVPHRNYRMAVGLP